MQISAETAIAIARAHREIEAATELLNKVEEARRNHSEPDIRDAFGRMRGCQLGVPSGESSHRILDLSWSLALPIIQAHISEKRAAVTALSEKARAELSQKAPA